MDLRRPVAAAGGRIADVLAGAASWTWRRYVCATFGHVGRVEEGDAVLWCHRCERWVRIS